MSNYINNPMYIYESKQPINTNYIEFGSKTTAYYDSSNQHYYQNIDPQFYLRINQASNPPILRLLNDNPIVRNQMKNQKLPLNYMLYYQNGIYQKNL